MSLYLCKTPLRIPLAGGGTDIPQYADLFEGYCISAAINKYSYIVIKKQLFSKKYYLKYSISENVETLNQIKHPIFKAIFNKYDTKPGIEIMTFMDLPHSSGLGSSSSFTVGLIKSINEFLLNQSISSKKLSKESIEIERVNLNEAGGIQDQVIASYGGIIEIFCKKNFDFRIKRMDIHSDILKKLISNFSLFFTGKLRSSNDIQNIIKNNLKNEKLEYLHKIKSLAFQSKKFLINGDLDQYGHLLNEHWIEKKKISKAISFPRLDSAYLDAIKMGCLGGKLIGSGGGGFLLMYCPNKNTSINVEDHLNKKYNFKKVDFNFEFKGSSGTHI